MQQGIRNQNHQHPESDFPFFTHPQVPGDKRAMLQAADDEEAARLLLRSRKQEGVALGQGGGGVAEDLGPNLVYIAGDHADIFLCPTSGLGDSVSQARIAQAMREKRPDVLITQVCPTRMRLLLDPEASIASFLDIRGAPYTVNLSRFTSLIIARWVWKALGLIVGRRRTLGMEYVEAIRLAAQSDVRVVLGDRDLPITISRAWDVMRYKDRLGIFKDFVVLILLPPIVARRLLGLQHMRIRRGCDAMIEVMSLLIERHPSLQPLLQESYQYMLSSIQKLDAPKATDRWHSSRSHPVVNNNNNGGGGLGGAVERPIVLAVLGGAHANWIIQNWGATIIDRRRLVTKYYLSGRASNSPPWWGRGIAFPLLFLFGLLLSSYLFFHIIVFVSSNSPSSRGPSFGIMKSVLQ